MATLRETVTWCQMRLATGEDPARALRSIELQPADLVMEGASLSGLTDVEIASKRVEIVFALARKRQTALAARPSVTNFAIPEHGRILGFEIDASFFDGVVAAETNGLFDARDLPPWDTWLAYRRQLDGRSQGILLSWIPAPLVDLAERAIKVHMCNAYQWVDLADAADSEGYAGAG